MKIFINGRFLTQEITGVQQFAREICRELIEPNSHEITILTPAKELLIDNEFSAKTNSIGNLKGHLWEQISLPLFLWRQKPYILINLSNTCPLLINNQIYTLHDLAFKKNPKWFNHWFSLFYNFLVPLFIDKSKYVITVSNTIKEELNLVFRVPPQKIIVIGNKVSTQLLHCNETKVKKENLKLGKFYLMVGTSNQRKNFELVEQFFIKNNNIQLVIVGGSHRAFIKNKKNLGIHDNIIRLNYVSAEELQWLYKNAKAQINPSLYEGFGIPNLEAMAFNCSVICSDIEVFKETCKEAAFYFSPTDENSLETCLNTMEDQTEAVSEKKKLGQEVFRFYQDQNRSQLIFNKIIG